MENPLRTDLSKPDEVPRFEFGLIRDQFDGFVVATGNRLEREWPKSLKQHGGSHSLVLGLYKAAHNTFGAGRFLLADTPASAARKLEYSIATPPLVRSLLESLAALVYIFADLQQHTADFFKAGWREGARETDRLRTERGDDPSWKEIIASNTEALKGQYNRFGITRAEAADVVYNLKPWPSLGSIVTKLAEPRKSYVSYLNDWLYKSLSDGTHPSWQGIGRALPLLIRTADEKTQTHELQLWRTKLVNTSLALMLALATEIDRELAFGDLERARYVWSILGEWDPDCRDLYVHIYESALGPAAVAKIPIVDAVALAKPEGPPA